MFETPEILDLAVQIERNGEKIYRDAVKTASTPSIEEMFRKLADDELRHIDFFIELKQSTQSKISDPELEEMGRTLLLGVMGSQSFSLEEKDMRRIRDLRSLLESAIEFEKDTIVFYEMMLGLVPEKETSAILQSIISEEFQHINIIEKYLGSGTDRDLDEGDRIP